MQQAVKRHACLNNNRSEYYIFVGSCKRTIGCLLGLDGFCMIV